MRTMYGDADAAPHDDAVNQRHIRLAIMLDTGVERIFRAKECERVLIPAATPKIIQGAQIAACREGAPSSGADHNAGDGWIGFPFIELLRERAHHIMRDGIERVRPVENDVTGHAASLEQDVRLGGQLPNISLLMITRITSLVPSRI